MASCVPVAAPPCTPSAMRSRSLTRVSVAIHHALSPDWYFQIALEKGWFGWHTYYCKVSVKASKMDARKKASFIDCSDTSVPYSSPFALLVQDGDQVRGLGRAVQSMR